jgi:HSP20 family protein
MLMIANNPSLYGLNPMSDLWRLQTDINRLFETMDGGTEQAGAYPPIDIWLGDSSVAVTAEMPGVAPDEIQISVHGDTLNIQGQRKPLAKDKGASGEQAADEGATWHRRERGFGAFARTIQLPFRVDPDAVQARYADGLLEVEMQRPKDDLPRKIEINAH